MIADAEDHRDLTGLITRRRQYNIVSWAHHPSLGEFEPGIVALGSDLLYTALRNKGKSHACALRCLGQGWRKFFGGCGKTRTAYDADRHGRNQLKHGPGCCNSLPKVETATQNSISLPGHSPARILKKPNVPWLTEHCQLVEAEGRRGGTTLTGAGEPYNRGGDSRQ